MFYQIDELLKEDKYDIYNNQNISNEDIEQIARVFCADRNVDHMQYFEFVTCNIDKDQGHIWVASTIQRYNANEEILPGGGKDIRCLWYIEHHEDAWNVVRILESP